MFIKKTKSLCPVCFESLEAEVYEEDGKIRIKKECPQHGKFDNTYWSNAEIYKKVNDFIPTIKSVDNPQVTTHNEGCPNNCGICENHETSTVLGLIDVTNRCNLKCPVCFANAATSKRLYEPSFDEIRQMLKNLRDLEPTPTPAIQYAGGEPTVRKDIAELLKLARDEGFSHTQIATNGLRIARKESFAKELVDVGLNTVYLQFDGVTEEPYVYNRGKNILPQKLKAIENCRKVGLGIVLVPTIVKGINDDQIGDIIRFAIKNRDIVHGVNFQPVSFAGRTPADQVEEQRVTIPDFIELVTEQTNRAIVPDDFYPPSAVEPFSNFIGALEGKEPSVTLNCHQHCGIATYIFVDDDEKIIPVTNFIDVDRFLELLDENAHRLEEGGFAIKSRVLASSLKEIPKVLDKDNTPDSINIKDILVNVLKKRSYDSLGDFHKNSLLISCMHFMDPFNFDEDRVKKCVIHYAVPDGRIIPFCTMNSIYRSQIEEEFSTPLKPEKTLES
ncbi:tetraether lipid synthase Tes [Methanobrevibacter filiformis]|uniref:Cyclic pyranopterin monophosphate synthase n=1 Tax=Methanobrevibacter filiformis TaxID=55758 RepID=A0A166CJV8_9EURY|nr:radical SAM protein [Methanobrevibacter filiformis]KZX14586.1 cyclic pyranopterin monophosphate synthase [Methanobrevibacter filiformis]